MLYLEHISFVKPSCRRVESDRKSWKHFSTNTYLNCSQCTVWKIFMRSFKLLAMYLEVMGDLKKVIDGSKMRRKHPLTRRDGWTCGFFVVCLYKIFTSSIAWRFQIFLHIWNIQASKNGVMEYHVIKVIWSRVVDLRLLYVFVGKNQKG